jgi:hypothetical protein
MPQPAFAYTRLSQADDEFSEGLPSFTEPLRRFVHREADLLWGIIDGARSELQGLLYALKVLCVRAHGCTRF